MRAMYDFPSTSRGRRGKGPRTKKKAVALRARRAAENAPAAKPRDRRSDDDTDTKKRW